MNEEIEQIREKAEKARAPHKNIYFSIYHALNYAYNVLERTYENDKFKKIIFNLVELERANALLSFIMEEFDNYLDLETWGLISSLKDRIYSRIKQLYNFLFS